MNWMDFANCKGKTFLFFAPARERPPSREKRQALAQQVCAECKVSKACREAAQGEFGIWAGESEDSFVQVDVRVLVS